MGPKVGWLAIWVPLLACPAVSLRGLCLALLGKPAVAPFFSGRGEAPDSTA